MRREILNPEVRLNLDNFPDALDALHQVNQVTAKQVAGDECGLTEVKRTRQPV